MEKMFERDEWIITSKELMKSKIDVIRLEQDKRDLLSLIERLERENEALRNTNEALYTLLTSKVKK